MIDNSAAGIYDGRQREASGVTQRTRGTVQLFLIGLNHRTAELALRERVAIPAREVSAALTTLHATYPATELVLLSTCNRVEVYLSSSQGRPPTDGLLHWLARRSGLTPEALQPHVYCYADRAAAAHLVHVTAGLDSMILGETEIAAQVKQAYALAHAQRTTGPILNRLFQKALHATKVVRSHTSIGHGQASIGAIVTRLAREQFNDVLSGRQVLLWGSGKAAEATVRHLMQAGVGQLWIVNRTAATAQALAAQCRGEWLSWERAHARLAHVDIAIICTQAPHFVIDHEDIMRLWPARNGRTLCLIDLAVPRNVDPVLKRHPGILLRDMDDLQVLAQRTITLRAQTLAQCEALIDQQLASLWPAHHPAPDNQERLACPPLAVCCSL